MKTLSFTVVVSLSLAYPPVRAAKEATRAVKFEHEVQEELEGAKQAVKEFNKKEKKNKLEICFKLGALTELLTDELDEVLEDSEKTDAAGFSKLKAESERLKEVGGTLPAFCGDSEKTKNSKEIREGNIQDLEKVLNELEENEKSSRN